MDQTALDLKVWKEIAISKQMLIKTVTDSLGIDSECTEEELKVALEDGVKQIAEADTKITKAKAENARAILALQDKLDLIEKSRKEIEEKNAVLTEEKEALDATLTSTRDNKAQEIKRLTQQLEEKNKALKKITTTLADSPENVVKKMKAMNKKKFDETNARKRAEDEAKSLRKEKQELKGKIEELEATKEESAKLVEAYRELHALSVTMHERLSELVEDEDDLQALPEVDEALLERLGEAVGEAEEEAA